MANASIIEQKQQVVNQLAEQMKNASSGVLVDYKGITVEDDTKLRANLRKSGVSYAVVKNTLCARACEAIGFGELRGVLEGTTALALSDDQVAPAKILNDFAKDHDNFVIKAGFVDGRILSADEGSPDRTHPRLVAILAVRIRVRDPGDHRQERRSNRRRTDSGCGVRNKKYCIGGIM